MIRIFIDNNIKYSTSDYPFSYNWETDKLEIGQHTISVVVEDNDGDTGTDEIIVIVKDEYTPPEACFIYSVGKDQTVLLDASSCYDNEDSIDDLQIRWDLNGDGVWDTDFTNEKQYVHQYPFRGSYKISMNVKDSHGESTVLTKKIKVLDGTVTDIDGNVYNTVIINGKEWMTENLRVTHYSNGDTIPNVTIKSEWMYLSSGACCAYKNEESNAEKYGYLYNWYAANDSRSIAPEGWHVATERDWDELAEFISDDNGGYTTVNCYYPELRMSTPYFEWKHVGMHLKYISGWDNNGNGIDDYYFSALPGGYRSANSKFFAIEGIAYFWPDSSGQNDTIKMKREIWFRSIGAMSSGLNSISGMSKGSACSVRCVRD